MQEDAVERTFLGGYGMGLKMLGVAFNRTHPLGPVKSKASPRTRLRILAGWLSNRKGGTGVDVSTGVTKHP